MVLNHFRRNVEEALTNVMERMAKKNAEQAAAPPWQKHKVDMGTLCDVFPVLSGGFLSILVCF